MKRVLLTITLSLMVLSTISCDKMASMGGGKQESEKIKEIELRLKEVEMKVGQLQGPQAGQADTPQPTEKLDGYVQLYDGKKFTEGVLTISFGQDIDKLSSAKSDDGKMDFNEKASAVKYNIPEGWRVSLFENDSYDKRAIVLKGSGAIADLSYFSDKCSSLRWEKKDVQKETKASK